jgi:hypothetical protein
MFSQVPVGFVCDVCVLSERDAEGSYLFSVSVCMLVYGDGVYTTEGGGYDGGTGE